MELSFIWSVLFMGSWLLTLIIMASISVRKVKTNGNQF